MLLNLHQAIELGDDAEFFENLLVGGVNVDASYRNGMTLLHLAVLCNRVEIIELLLKKKLGIIDVATAKDLIPLHVAANKDDIEIVKQLLKSGTDINLQINDYGFLALTRAVFEDFEKVTELLLKNGADVNLSASDGAAVLHIAVRKSKIIVSLIFEKQADINLDINLTDMHGCTPLHYAVCFGFMRTTELLLSKGAKVNITDNKFQTPVDNAINNVISVNRVVSQNKVKIAKLLISAVLSENPEKIKPKLCKINDELSDFWDETQAKTKSLVASISTDFVNCFSKNDVCCSMKKFLNDNPNKLIGIFSPKVIIKLAEKLKETQQRPGYEVIDRWLSQVSTRLEKLSCLVNKKFEYCSTLAHKHVILCSNEGKTIALDKYSQNEVLKNLAINDIKSFLKAAKLNTTHNTNFFKLPAFLANVTNCVKSRCVIS